MLTFESHPKEVQQMRDIINRNIYYGVLFIKADKSLRPLNGRKVKYVSQKKDGETRGIWNRKEHNILTVFDRNKQQEDSQGNLLYYKDEKTGKVKPLMNAPRSIKLDRLLFFKAGNVVLDFTGINSEAIKAAGIKPQQLEAEKERMKITTDSGELQNPLEIVDPDTITANPNDSIEEIVMSEISEFYRNDEID